MNTIGIKILNAEVCMETLMIQAIRQFKREHKGCEIRSISTAEGTGKAGKWGKVLFNIQFVDIKENNISGGGYASCYLEVTKKDN